VATCCQRWAIKRVNSSSSEAVTLIVVTQQSTEWWHHLYQRHSCAVCYRSRYVVKFLCNSATASCSEHVTSDVISRCADAAGGRWMSSPRSYLLTLRYSGWRRIVGADQVDRPSPASRRPGGADRPGTTGSRWCWLELCARDIWASAAVWARVHDSTRSAQRNNSVIMTVRETHRDNCNQITL